MVKYSQVSMLCLRVFEPSVLFAVGEGHRSKNEIPTIIACFWMLCSTEKEDSLLFLIFFHGFGLVQSKWHATFEEHEQPFP